jgi:hypothetical protein
VKLHFSTVDLLVTVAAILAATTAAAQAQRSEELKARVVNLSLTPDRTFVASTPHGTAQSVIGRFDVGLISVDLSDSVRVATATARFVAENDDIFYVRALASNYAEPAVLVATAVHPDDEKATIQFVLEQESKSVRWLSSQVIAVFDIHSAELLSLSGDLRLAPAWPLTSPRLSEEDAAALFGVTDELDIGARLSRGIDPARNVIAWDYNGIRDRAARCVWKKTLAASIWTTTVATTPCPARARLATRTLRAIAPGARRSSARWFQRPS